MTACHLISVIESEPSSFGRSPRARFSPAPAAAPTAWSRGG